ncbi:nesprin-2-like protein [Labeo rohita]|uniref:Nesprin-2-like protein n=1 Tax=Labeo rohita TaxID=84645 RepID=A0A498M917_LABRO|nr:nesprin-2-like protein [Labeo rohita]
MVSLKALFEVEAVDGSAIVEQEQIQKRTFTNWINAQLSKRSHPTVVQDLFSDLRDGTQLLDLLEVMSGQRMKRERGHGVFQQRGNIETALNFLKNKSIKLVNINIPDIIEGKPSIILGLIWTIILHCHIEELANTLSYGSRSSSLDSLSSLDSVPGSPSSSPVPRGGSPLHTRFRLSAKKSLLLWVRDQCKKVGCSASVRDFKSSWRSGEVFLAILCSLRPDLVDLSQAQTSSHRENLERAFHLAEKELGIPRLLEPEDVDVSKPDEKSIMTYIAQFLQYSNDLPAADDDFEASPSQKAREMKCWLEGAYQELLEAWSSTEGKGYAERYQLQEYRTELDVGLPTPLNTLGRWLQHMEAVLSEDSGSTEDHALAARDARHKQEHLEVLVEDLSQHLNTLNHYRNTDEDGCLLVPVEKLEEIKRRFTSARVTAKYHGIKLQYREHMHHVYNLLGCLKSKLSLWRGPYGSQESVRSLLQDWHDTVDKQGLLWMLKEALHKLKDTAVSYTKKAALAEDSPVVNRQVKEADTETEITTEAAEAVRSTMERVLTAWESYKDCLYLLQVWLGQEEQSKVQGQESKHFSSSLNEWRSRQAQLNEAGNFLIEISDASTSQSLTEELRKLNMHWADFIKRTKFAVAPQPVSGVPGVQAAQSLMQEASWVLRETVEVSSGPIRIYRKKLKVIYACLFFFFLFTQGIIKKMSEFDLNSLSPSPDCKEETLQKLRQTLPESLFSRGLQLEGQVVTESEDLQMLVTSMQKNSSLPYLSTLAIQDRLKRTVSHCQEVTEMLSSHGVKREGQPDGAEPASKNEVYARAQALARSRLDKAKQHLQEHIQDVITVISTRDKSKKQAKKKQAVSRLLRPVVLETFLEAVKGMGDFCSDAQLKDMDLLSHSVRAQWEVCATAAERSVHLEALRRITESLQATESVLLRTTHLRTDAKRVESAQHHTDSTSDLTPCQDGRVGAVKDSVLLGKTVLLDDLSHVHSQAVVQTNIVEIKQIPERTVIHPCLAQEEKDSAEEAQSSYSAVRSVFQQQLLNNSQQLGSEFPISPGGNASISADSLRSQLQHLLALKDQTEALWCEFELQDSQSSQHMEDGCNMEQEKAQLIQQWREQQMCIQARVKSLETAVELLESADSQIRLISDQIKQISQKPLNIRNLSIADPRNLHEDLKRLDERIEKELVLLNSGGSVSDAADLSHIELQAHLPLLPQTLHDRTKCLEQQRQCLRKSESALVGLVKLLSHLQQVSADLSGAHSTSDRSLVSIRHSLQQAREESVQLDRLLDDAGMRITLDDKAGSCNEMVSALALRTEEVEAKLAVGLKQSDRGGKGRVEGEQRDRAVGRKRMGLQVALREVLTALEKHGLKEPTLPALQHRLRFLTDTESKLVALRSEIQDLRSTCAQTNTSDTGISELQMQWENAHGAVAESREQCVSLSELLKKFQSCRNHLGSTLQKAEQTIGDQASYMGKDNLQLLISKVTSLKSDLSGLGDGVEEFRAVCRQLQSLMRRIPDCAEAPFEIMYSIGINLLFQVTEKTDCHLDNLQAGFSLWEKLLLLAGEVEGWSAQKLMTLAESHPFQTEQDVSAMQDELRIQEENIEHFHRRSSEIQELLQSREFPLELQVIESQLGKKMAEVKELFSETSDVFTQLEAAKGKVASDIADHLSSIQSIANALTSLTTSATSESPQVLSEQLQAEAKQADALLQQINLLASIAGLENLQALAEDGVRLQESICTARELLVEKKEQAMNPNRPEIPQMIRDPKHVKPQIRKTEDAAPEIQSELGEKTQDALLELKDFKEQACSSALHQQGDFQVSEDVNRAVTLEESLREVQDVRVGLDESMNEELKCAMLIQQSQESLHSLQGQTEHSSQDSNASKAVEQGEGNLLEVENLSEVLQTSCTPEGQTALSQDVQTLFGKTPALRKILEDERTQEWNSDPVQSSIQCIEPQQPGVSTEELQSVQVAADSEVDDVDRINLEFLSTKEGSETEDKSPCTDQQAAEDVESLPSDHNTNKQQFKSGSKEGAKTGSALRDDDSTSCESSKPVFTIVLDSDLTKLNLIPLTQSVPASSTKWDTVSAVNDGTSETSENGLKLLEVKPDEEPYAVAADSEVDDVNRINLEFLSTKEGSETEDKSPCTDQQAAEDVESLPSDHNSNKQQFKSGSKERAKTGSALRDDDGTSCESSKPVFTIVLDSDLTKPNQIPLTQPIPGSSTKWDTVAAVGPDDGTSETSENGLKLLEVKPDEEPYAVSSSDKPVHLCADPSTSEVHFKENSHADHVEPTYSASDLDFSPKPEIDSSTQAMLLYPENLQESSGTAKKVFTIILDVDTPILSSDKYQSLQETQCTGPEDSITDEFSYLDIKNQQRSSSSPAKPEGQMVELDLSEKSNVKSSSSRSCEMKPHFLETMEIDIQEEKEKQHEVADVETSSQMDVHSESKSVVHQQDVPMLESHHEDDKNTFKQPSNEASTLQKPPKGGKGRRKNRKPVGVEKASNIGSEKPKSCKSRHKNTTDSESLRTSEVRLPETTDTSLTVSSDFSQTKSAMPRSTEDKLTVDTVQTLNQSETENVHFENVSISFTGGTLINTTDSVVLAAAESVRSTHTDDSKLMAEDSSSVVTADCITQVSTTIPSESQLGSAEAPSTGDSEGRFSLQESRQRKDSWLQNSSLSESESSLAWTVLWVFRCRYRPSQLSVAHMTHQLEQAEICRQHVLEQVARLTQRQSSAGPSTEPEQSIGIEGRWNTALMDTSNMVEFKKAQLQQVTQYHQQKRVLTDTLHNLEAELSTLTQVCIDSSTLQAEKLNAFLKNMQKKRGILEELLQTCSQISSHLGEAEGPVACIEPFRALQERWQNIEQVASSSLWCANISTAEVSALLQEARNLHHELELLEKSVSLPHPSQGQMDCQSALKETVRTADFAVLTERYLYLFEVSQALSSSPLGKKELRDVEVAMQGLNSQLALTQEKLSSQTSNGSGYSPIMRIIRDYVTWAKQTESKVSRRRTLSLFPEEAIHQVNHMKKLQSETSLKRFQLASVLKELREEVTGLDKEDSMSPTLDSLEDLYVKLTEKTECAAAEMSRMFHIRERLWKQLTDSSSWLTSVLEKESGKTVASEPKTTIPELRVQLQVCTEALKEAERQAHNLETLLDELKNVNHGLSVPESFQLISRLTALQEEVSRVVNRKWALRWVLEELLHAQESSAEEQNVILKSLRQMSADVTRQKYPITRDSLSALEPVRHILMEFLCKVPEIQHCQEPRRKEMLNAVLDIQRRMHVLELQAKEHEEYLVLKQHMENSREAVKKSLSQIVDSSVGADVRLGFCQAVLVELPLLRMTCQEAADHLEAISKDLYPSQLTAERQKIRLVIEQLASWELTVKNEAKNLECSLAERLGSPTDLSPLTELFNSVRQQLKDTICLEPDNKTIDAELRKHWIRIQTVESVLRMLERCRKGVDAKSCQMTIDLGQRTLNDCGMHMDKLLQAREALKHYHWAVQLAESFFQQIGSNLMIPSDGFRGYKEEHRYIQQIFSTLVEGFQARLSDVGASVPQMTCLSIPLTEQLHIKVLSHLLVQDAKLEAQAQLRLETLQRSMKDQIVHMSHHEEVLQTEIKNLAKRLEELREGCPGLRCKAPVDLMLGQLWRSWAVLQCRVESLKASMSHKEAEWRDFVIRLNKSKEGLDRLQNELPDSSVVTGSLVDLQGVLSLTERLQDGIEQEHHTLSSLQHHVTRLLGVSNLQQLKVSPQICQDLQSLQGHCRNLRDQSNNIRREVLFEIQELGRVQEELSAIQQNVLSLLTVLQSESAAQHLQEVKVELVSQKAQLQDVMDRVQKKWNCIPSEIQVLQNELSVSMQEAKDKLGMVMERSGPLCKMGELLGEVTVGLKNVQALLKQTSPNFSEAERTQKRVWDELDQWHTRIAELEAEVQDLAEQKPERAHVLMDQLTEPLQLYQTTAKQAEQRTALISKIPACLQEYDGILNSSNCWLREAQSWLIAPRTYTTAKCIHCHANSLKMMLDESEGYRGSLEDFLPALQEITPVCDTTPQQHLLQLCMQNITLMQQSVLDPLSHLQHLAAEMDAIEDEVKTMENNITKIRTILSATDTENISPEEHLENMQVILDNVQSMKRTIDEIESCRPGLGLPAEAEQTLTAFHWAQELLQPIQELQQLSMERSTALRASIGQPAEMILPLGQTEEFTMPHLYTEDVRDPGETTIDEEDFKTGADSAVTECVTKESSPEDFVDVPAVKHVIQDADTGSCLLEPSDFSEMPGVDSRPVTEETTSLSAPTFQHLKEFTNDSCLKPDSANIAEEKQNECTETRLTKAVPTKPGIGSEITMLKASDAAINTETGTSDHVKTMGRKPLDTEVVRVTDGDQTQTASSQRTACVPHEETTLEIQRDLNEAVSHQSRNQSQEFQHTARGDRRGEEQDIKVQLLTSLKETAQTLGSCQDICDSEEIQRDLNEVVVDQSSSQSQEHTFKHTATVSDLSQSEGGGEEDQDIKVQLLTSLKETSETLGSCQDISALEGLRGHLELGSERLLRSQDAQPQNCSQLQSLLTGHKKYFQDLGQNLVVVKLLYQKLPEGALQGQAEVDQLISALQDQAQTHGVRMQHSLEEWSQYEEVSERLGKQLDEIETNISSLDSGPEGDLQGQLQSCEHDSAELEEWIRRAQEQVRKWNSSSDSGLVDFETVFTQLMEFFKELEVHSAQKASAESAGAQILQLTNSEAPGLRRQLAQLEQEWTNLTNELPTLHQAQQQLLTNQTDSQILANLTSWLKHVEKRLEDESSGVHCALGSSELSRHLQALKDLKAEITSNQLYVDFLNRQFVEEAGSLNEPTNRSEHILFAEQLGALNLSWLILQGKIESKMHDVEDQWQASADREKRLCCMHSWISQRMHWVRNSQRPESCSQIEQTLQECEETEERLQVKSSELKALGGLHLFGQQDGEHPGDQAFSKQVNSAIQDAQALSQQINVLKSDLQPVKDEWAHFESKMSAAELQTTGVVYKLKLYRVPVLSSEQCRTQVEHLQELERELNRPETGTHLTEVFSDLKDKLSPYASKLLSDRLEKETARHQAVTEDVHADLLKAQNALRLWLEYERLTGECCVHLNQHWERLGELMNSSYKLENAVELLNSRMQSINDLEKDMPALQSSVGKVLEASKLLTGQMTPQSAPLIESETRLLSRDHLHLSKALSDIGAQVQEELEEHRRFSTELKSMEQQLKNFERIVSSSATSMESLKMVLLDLNGLNPNLAALNQTSFGLSLSSTEKERLQTLNTQWAQVFSQGSEQHRQVKLH